MAQLFNNNAKSRLSADISETSTTFTILTSEGSLFPVLDASGVDHFMVTLENASGQREIVTIVARSGDTFTVGIPGSSDPNVLGRGQEGTTARGFIANDLVELRLTAGFIDAIKKGSIVFVVDGGGSAITTGMKGFIELPFSGSIEAVRLFADLSGDIVFDIYKDTYENYDPTIDQSGDSIVGTAPPTISSGFKSEILPAALVAGNWVRNFEAGEILYFDVTTCNTITKCTISLTVDRN
jgi:hypothetical protein